MSPSNKHGTCEQWIKEDKGGIKWPRLSCRTFAANAVRLQLHALAYNLGNFLRTLATPQPIKDWSLRSLKGEAHQDRRQGREPRALCRLPDGRGRDPSANVPGDFAAHRGTAAATATSASVRRSIVVLSAATDRRSASKCLVKWSDRALNLTGMAGRASTPPTRAFKRPGNRYNAPKFGFIRGIPAERTLSWPTISACARFASWRMTFRA